MTRSPINACWIVAPAPIAQSRPMLTPGPMTAPAAITVPAPISASAPMTASGSTVTFASRRADGCTCASLLRPFTPNNDDGRKASGNSARVTATKARYGSGVTRTASPCGALASKRGLTKQAPARVTAKASRNLGLSRKLMSAATAVSSGAILLMRRSSGSPARGLARVSAAISSIVSARWARSSVRHAPVHDESSSHA